MLVHHVLENCASKTPDKNALICGQQRYTYGEINARANSLAIALIEMGTKRHDRVVLFLDNSVEAVIALFGVLKAGAIFILPNAALKAEKLSHILADSGAKLLITHLNKARVVKNALENTPTMENIVWCQGPNHKRSKRTAPLASPTPATSWDSLVANRTPLDSRFFPRQIDLDLATIIYTSSPDGKPRGVMWAHANIVSAVRSIDRYFGNQADDVFLSALPLAFDYGLYQIFLTFCCGGTLILEKSFIYPYQVMEKIDALQVTAFPIVPTMAALLLEIDELAGFKFPSLKYISNTTGTLPAASIKKLCTLFPHVQIYSMYGLPECQRVSYLPPQDIAYKPDSVGLPMPNLDARILTATGKAAAPNHAGELVVRGSNVMRGYWNAPDLTARKFSRDPVTGTSSWLHTGDLFRQDEEGYLYFVAHMDDTAIIKGERISRREVESALCDFPGVKEAAVITVPDKFDGKAMKAFVVPAENKTIDEKQLLRHLAAKLEPVMLPKYIEFRDHLPKAHDGRIDKKSMGRHGRDRRSNQDRRQIARITLTNGTTAFVERRTNNDRRSGRDRRRMEEPTTNDYS